MNKNIECFGKRSRADRFADGDGKHCEWVQLAAAAVGAIGAMQAAKQQRKAAKEAAEAGQQATEVPEIADWQRPYVLGQGWTPRLPQVNPYAMNYGTGLMGGYNPSFGPASPMGFQGLLGSLGYGQQQPVGDMQAMGGTPGNMPPGQTQFPQPAGPWFQDPNMSPFNITGGGGMAGLLGYGAATPPPLLTSNPFYSGQNVTDPSLLMQGPGIQQDFTAAESLLPPPPPEAPEAVPVNMMQLYRELEEIREKELNKQRLRGFMFREHD